MIKNSLRGLLNVKYGIVLLVVLETFALRYYYNSYHSLKTEVAQLKLDPQEKAKAETKALVAQVSKLVVLPTGEEPVVATVTDKEKLKDQPVFEKAENGDKILIYGNAKKAYIYSPSKNVVVDVIPVNIGETAITIPGVDEKNPLRLALYNGTKSAGLTVELEKRIVEKKVLGLSVTAKANASSTTYQKTQIIDLTGKKAEQVAALAKLLDGEVATESSEIRPNADVLVVIGENFK
ncbi:MAG: hypothetical protein UX12_C0031G0009 [Candidatus Collierbacteria bacterium GW2011_GWC1_45_47]|uniref:LytR/CpsA/Psr regulator C-terminal domain-containing protein n=3 Tax=Candidatus Collieribacteriota TaxID=1752725 RepID=A0A0G1S2L3_9BACT|nr:MAG: hypothetical protein UW23_C0016G0009 [Candidatus Collierbacteria bacterium GW2011_GWA1_44_12]KKT37773.1 MAG: hypothetical protein UW26_C0025G0012 [Candidatus Collierbacteria bacterium GW2011_GWF1_44_12]KKU08814.1 MAG: hypothetical protein UX12_C0031G0009 [Candidatus Collierbacteria bacterium GW2011_GWC1_45_47]KKU27460.1 MAG: hypothetical protein UX41_C0051G0008 [Candidatus Collierbacteria bacterium GW2011_GWE1_46_18]